MRNTLHTVRKSLLPRGMKYVIGLVLLVGALMLYLLSKASANSPLFARDLRSLLVLGVALVLGLLVLVGYQLLALRRRVRAGTFGSKLTVRLVLLFSLVAVLPGALVYSVSVQFLNKSIESWFNVRVDKALEGGLSLGRTTLDNMLRDLTHKAEAMSLALDDLPPTRLVTGLNQLREQAAVQEAAVFLPDGTVLAFSGTEGAGLMPNPLPAGAARQVRLQQPYREVDTDAPQGLVLRVVVPINSPAGGTHALQLVQPVATPLARDMSLVQSMYEDYQELSMARNGLKRLYGLSLTLALLLALLSALVLAILFSERLSAPLVLLAAGTRAVAQGDFSQRHPVRSQDELGVLTDSFNRMTTQLAEARAVALRNQEQLQAANGYLESVLAKLSAGVLSFDHEHRLRSANPSAEQILAVPLQPLIGKPLEDWAGHSAGIAEVAQAILEAIIAGGAGEWEKQLETGSASANKVLRMRGSALPESESGFVVVFDDITRLLQAQRHAAWGEVARRLAHEIKNPLTPIQLSAERLEHRLAAKLAEPDAAMLSRSTRTIVKQVAQLKGMVDAFSQYARSPEMQLQPLDLNMLVREVLTLYEAHRPAVVPDLQEDLPAVRGDPARLRQVIHNLLQNAEQAVAESSAPRIRVRTRLEGAVARLTVSDNGPGFPADVLQRVFEPYVTTRAKGTGLGLAIVKKIMEEHSGSIEIANAESGGAQVAVTLPIAGQAAVEDRPRMNAQAG